MAKRHGRHTYISLDGTDISAYCSESSFDRSADSHDTTTYGATAHAVGDDGLLKHSGSMSGLYDNTTSGPHDLITALIGTNVTLVRRPEGTGTGLPQESMTVRVTKYSESNPVADYVKWSADFDVDGDITDTDQA